MLYLSCVSHVFASHAALWSPAGKGLTSSLSFVMLNCVFVTFPCGILGQVWYLIVLIPDLCSLSYFGPMKRFLKEFFEKHNFEKVGSKQQNQEKLPSMRMVKCKFNWRRETRASDLRQECVTKT